MPIAVRRLLDRPIIHQGMSASLGDNINGPSLIRVPDWVEDPLGRYLLYFAHHEGRSIRLAYSNALTGPWVVHEPGALRIEQSLFPHDRSQITPRPDGTDPHASLGITQYVPHIASPDVLVDQGNRRVLMYYHGMTATGDQMTRLAISANGVDFRAKPKLFTHYYFRVVEYRDWYWAISWGGYLFRAPNPDGPFERGPATFETEPLSPPGRTLRHLALLMDGDRLHLFFSRIGDAPEAILHAEVSLHADWHRWAAGAPREVLRPVEPWEGAALPVRASRAGAARGPEHALRDPCIFRDDDGRVYLLYSGAAEQAIGIAEVTGL